MLAPVCCTSDLGSVASCPLASLEIPHCNEGPGRYHRGPHDDFVLNGLPSFDKGNHTPDQKRTASAPGSRSPVQTIVKPFVVWTHIQMQLLSTVAQFKNPTMPALTRRKFLELASTILPAVGRPFVSEQLGPCQD